MNEVLERVWVAATYHLPTTYSYRVPMSSSNSIQALPTPGPGTVRLALLKVCIELFGEIQTRDLLFPTLRSARLHIEPPARIALTTQLLRGYKVQVKAGTRAIRLGEGIMYREIAHADGNLRVFLEVPVSLEPFYSAAFTAIGYWGQSNSLACCIDVRRETPVIANCVHRLRDLAAPVLLAHYFAAIASEFRDADVTWGEVIPEMMAANTTAIQLDLYVWPLTICERRGSNTLLRHCSLS